MNKCIDKKNPKIKYSTNSKSLSNRLDVNKKFSKNDLNSWIFSQLKVKPTDTILDLCSGTGNQAFILAKKAKKGTVYALDLSKKSLDQIDKKRVKNIKTKKFNLDNISKLPFKDNSFDIIHCSYGLYYASDATRVIQKMYQILKPGGIFMVVGPTDDNNKQLFDLIEMAYKIDKRIIYTSRDFMPKLVLPKTKKLFRSVKQKYFKNTIIYPDTETLYRYISSSTMFKKKHDKKLKENIDKYFIKNNQFKISKKAMSLICTK
jgi:ubiquinone/menaquinone biosynthesis C-methylase UbiE